MNWLEQLRAANAGDNALSLGISVPLPWLKSSTGGGDVLAGMTHAVGLTPCPPCEARRQTFNSWLQFVPYSEDSAHTLPPDDNGSGSGSGSGIGGLG